MSKRDHSVMSRLNKRQPLGLFFCSRFSSVLQTLAVSLAPTGIDHCVQNVVRM
jgi:hypothetical protein